MNCSLLRLPPNGYATCSQPMKYVCESRELSMCVPSTCFFPICHLNEEDSRVLEEGGGMRDKVFGYRDDCGRPANHQEYLYCLVTWTRHELLLRTPRHMCIMLASITSANKLALLMQQTDSRLCTYYVPGPLLEVSKSQTLLGAGDTRKKRHILCPQQTQLINGEKQL